MRSRPGDDALLPHKLRSTMLKHANFKDANAQIKIRIKTAQETMTDRKPEDLHNYYMAHLNAMRAELTSSPRPTRTVLKLFKKRPKFLPHKTNKNNKTNP